MKAKRNFLPRSAASLLALLAIPFAAETQAAIVSYYIGVDGRETIPSGLYAGLPNPNHNRLTFLYAHNYPDNPSTNHYHAKGVIVYTGPNLGASTATTVAATNFLPEGSAAPLLLQAGSGAYAGKLVNIPAAGNDFSKLTIEDTGRLSSFAAGTPEEIMFNSSGGRWNGSIAGSDVHMKLVFATAGLFFGTASDPLANPFADPEGLHLTDSFSFTLHPWVDAAAAPGVYIAQFELEDEDGLFGESGVFEYRFEVIPEPSSALMALMAGAVFAFRRRRHA